MEKQNDHCEGNSSSASCSPPDWDSIKWRQLEHGEVIKEGDWVDMCRDGWRDEPKWVPSCSRDIGTKAPDPRYPAHRVYRRPMRAIVYKAQEAEWIVITSPDTPEEAEVATCKSQELGEALCKGMGWDYTVSA